MPEAWLRGPVEGVPSELMPAAHSLMDAVEEIEAAVSGHPTDALWLRPGGAASIGFHLRHARGSIGRLLTYARGEALTSAEIAAIRREGEPGTPAADAGQLLAELREAVDGAIDTYRRTDPGDLDRPRKVGRAGLPSTTRGLLFHLADHTRRHAGQVVTTAKIIRAMMNQGPTQTSRDSFRKGDRLPSVGLQDRFRPLEVRLRPSRGPRVLVSLHRQDCDVCVGYVSDLAATRERLESWGADLVVVGPESTPDGAPMLQGLGVPVLEDPTHVVTDGRLTVIISDQWGRVYFASEPEELHGPVAPEEVVEWVKFVAIQCPECEGPEGEWRNV